MAYSAEFLGVSKKFFYTYHHFQVNYINAHATSTLVGDLAEVNAIKKVFKNTSEIKMNATKVRYLYISVQMHVILNTYGFQTE